MKWFKHQSDAHMNAKLQKVLIRYGAQGYGLYWFCLECVAGNISDHKLTFELEHDAEILAHHLKMDSRLVEEVMTYMVKLGLFENRSGTITCLKMAKRLDQSMTSSPMLRRLISGKKNHDGIMTELDKVMTESGNPMPDKTRLDKKRKDSQPSTEDRELADRIWKRIRDLDRKQKEPNMDKWANDIRLMRQRDERTHYEIKTVFLWANADSFWQSNILSPAKLREQFVKLSLQMKGNGNANGNGYKHNVGAI